MSVKEYKDFLSMQICSFPGKLHFGLKCVNRNKVRCQLKINFSVKCRIFLMVTIDMKF